MFLQKTSLQVLLNQLGIDFLTNGANQTFAEICEIIKEVPNVKMNQAKQEKSKEKTFRRVCSQARPLMYNKLKCLFLGVG